MLKRGSLAKGILVMILAMVFACIAGAMLGNIPVAVSFATIAFASLMCSAMEFYLCGKQNGCGVPGDATLFPPGTILERLDRPRNKRGMLRMFVCAAGEPEENARAIISLVDHLSASRFVVTQSDTGTMKLVALPDKETPPRHLGGESLALDISYDEEPINEDP